MRECLRRALSSAVFTRAPAISRFLEYVVEQALLDDEATISAYAVATEALGRSEDFDPQIDPVVRVTAGRLRQALDRYYAGEGGSDPIRIRLPSGGYTPSFLPQADVSAAEPTDTPAPTPSAETPVAAETAPLAAAQAPAGPVSDHARAGDTVRPAAPPEPQPQREEPGPPLAAETQTASRPRLAFAQLIVPLTAAFGGALIFALALLFSEWMSSPPAPTLESKIQTSSVDEPALAPVAPQPGADDLSYRPDIFPRLALDATHVEALPAWYDARVATAAARSVAGRFDEMSLVSEVNRDQADYDLIIEAFGREDAVRVFMRLEQRRSGTLVWSRDYELTRSQNEAHPSLTDFFGRALSPVLSPYGILLSDLSKMENPPQRLLCVLKAYAYFDNETLRDRLAAHECLDAMISNGVVHPTIFALKAFLHLEGYRTSRTVVFDKDDPLHEAQIAASRAVDASPGSARAHQANFAVFKVERRREQALRSADLARQANPYDLDVLADVAAYLGSQGLHAEAAPLFRETSEMSLQLPSWLIANYAFHLLMTGDSIGAYELALSRPPTSSPILAAAMAITAHDRDDDRTRAEAIAALLNQEPAFLIDPADRFHRRGFASDVSRVLGERLREATVASGLDVDLFRR